MAIIFPDSASILYRQVTGPWYDGTNAPGSGSGGTLTWDNSDYNLFSFQNVTTDLLELAKGAAYTGSSNTFTEPQTFTELTGSNIRINGEANIGGNLNVNGTSYFDDTLTINGGGVFNGDIISAGSISSSVGFSGSGANLYGVTASTAISASYALTASFALNGGGNVDTSSLVTTSSFNAFTSSVTTTASFDAFTGSYLLDSASFSASIANITFDTSSLTTTASFNAFTSSVTTTASFDAFTGSYYADSASFSASIANITFDTSSLATTASLNTFITSSNLYTASINDWTSSVVTTSSFDTFTSSIEGVTGSFATTASFDTFTGSYYADSASFSASIANISFDTSSLATTSSVLEVSASLSELSASYLLDSASFSASIANINNWTSSAATLSNLNASSSELSSSTAVLSSSFLVFSSSVSNSLSVANTDFNTFTSSVYNAFTASYNTGSFQGNLDGTATTASYINLEAGPGISLQRDPSTSLLSVTSSVRTVNGVSPSNGNVSLSITQTLTGPSSSLAVTPSPYDTGSIWVISGDPNPALNGETFILVSESFGSTPATSWQQLSGFDVAAADARYLKLDGANGPMSGDVDFGTFQINNLGEGTLSSDAINLGQLTQSVDNATGSVITLLNVSSSELSASLIADLNTSSSILSGSTALLSSSFIALSSSFRTGSFTGSFEGIAETASYVDIKGNGIAVNYNGSEIQLTASIPPTPTLQSVTTAGNSTTSSLFIGNASNAANIILGGAGLASSLFTEGNLSIQANDFTNGVELVLDSNNQSVQITGSLEIDSNANTAYFLPPVISNIPQLVGPPYTTTAVPVGAIVYASGFGLYIKKGQPSNWVQII